MEENQSNIYTIPPNYTDSGRIFGGMVILRNAVEAILLAVFFGFIELKIIPMDETVRIIVMALTLIPLFVFALIGIDGESLLQYGKHIANYLFRRRKIYMRGQIKNEEKE